MATGMAYSSSLTNDEIKHRVLNVYAKFVSDVEPDRLFDFLVQEHVITIDQKQMIHHVNSIASGRCRAILDHLFSIKHPRAFLVVRQALKEDNHYLLETIDDQEPGPGIRKQTDEQYVLQAKIEELEKDLMRHRSLNTQLAKNEDELKQLVDQLKSELKLGTAKTEEHEEDLMRHRSLNTQLAKNENELKSELQSGTAKIEELEKDLMRHRSLNTQLAKNEDELKQPAHQLKSDLQMATHMERRRQDEVEWQKREEEKRQKREEEERQKREEEGRQKREEEERQKREEEERQKREVEERQKPEEEERKKIPDSTMRVSQVMKGTMSAKTTYQKSAKGPVAIYHCSQDGKYIELENTGRKDEFLGNWSLTRNVDESYTVTYKFSDSFVLRPGQKIKVWAKGTRPFTGAEGDIESDEFWGVGQYIVTKLLNPLGEDRATHIQKTKYV